MNIVITNMAREGHIKNSVYCICMILSIHGHFTFMLEMIKTFKPRVNNYRLKNRLKEYSIVETEETKSQECSICMENGVNMELDCKHRFHSECILKWTLNSGNDVSCPLCRTKILTTV